MSKTTCGVDNELRHYSLEGRHVRLEPLSYDHLDSLCAVGMDSDIWRWMTITITSRSEMRAYIQSALEGLGHGNMRPFAIIEQAQGRVVGSTRFGAIAPAHRRVEIGWTWIAKQWQRTAVNTESKLLMLTDAFEVQHYNRVEFKTDSLNERSRKAIQRLGAQFEGILRKHIVTAGGRVRDTVYYSILNEEWPVIKAKLCERLSEN